MAEQALVDSDTQLLIHKKLTGEALDFYEDEVFTDGARNGPGYVYLLSEHTKTNGQSTSYYKIGVSSRPEKRIADLQTGNPRPLFFQRGPIRVSKVISAERLVHKAVASYASGLGGGQEWFYVPEKDWENFLNCYQKALSEYAEEPEASTHTPR